MERRFLVLASAFLFWPAASLSQTTTQSDLVCFETGVECVDVSLDVVVTADEYGCLDFCKATPGCLWFTWHPDDGICFAFPGCDDNAACDDSCIRGEVGCTNDGGEAQCDVVGRCLSVAIDSAVTSSASQCLTDVCQPNPQCQWYTFDSSSGICLAFEDCDDFDASCGTCVSGEDECEVEPPDPGQDYPNVVVMGGYENGNFLSGSEVFSMDGTSACSPPPDLPSAARDFSAEYFDGFLSVCGGLGEDLQQLSECYQLDPSSNAWITRSPLLKARSLYASVVTPQGWWILGGLHQSAAEASTEIHGTQDAWTAGPDIPEPLDAFCAVQINNTHTMIAGGRNPQGVTTDKAWMYDWTRSTWNQLPPMPDGGRGNHGCEMSADGGTVVLAGGSLSSGALSTSAVFNLNSETWTAGPPLPSSADGPASVTIDGRPALIGGLGSPNGYSGDFLQLDQTGSAWSVLSQELSLPRYAHAAAAVPDEALSNCS